MRNDKEIAELAAQIDKHLAEVAEVYRRGEAKEIGPREEDAQAGLILAKIWKIEDRLFAIEPDTINGFGEIARIWIARGRQDWNDDETTTFMRRLAALTKRA